MSARPNGVGGGTLFCDAKTPTGYCKREFESLAEEPYLTCVDRAVEDGWNTLMPTIHFCPDHAWIK